MRVHWFAHSAQNISTSELKSLIKNLDVSGYYSVLLPYHSQLPDMFIKSANVINNDHKIKIMIALRARSISPEYCAMMCSSFDQIQSDRLMLNILHGSPDSGENNDGIIDYGNIFSSREKTVKHTEIFLSKLKNNFLFNASNTELVMSGGRLDSIEMSNLYADYCATDYQNLINNTSFYSDVEKLIVTMDLVIKNENNEQIKKDLDFSNQNLIYLTEKEILNFFNDLRKMGVTDVMFTSPDEKLNPQEIHNFVRENLSAILAI